MPSTEDATLQLIQREISEVVQREKELRENHSRPSSRNEISSTNGSDARSSPEPTLERAHSATSFTNGYNTSTNGGRMFAQNPTTKGVMQRFIKSRGKLNAMTTITTKKQTPPTTWASSDFIESTKPIVPTGMQPRNGFVPVEERIRREFLEMQKRETELRSERQKSQPDLLALLDLQSAETEKISLRSARSVSQLSDDTYDGSMSAPSSLKAARSLAELCDVDDEEIQPPGSLTLIKQWENLIQKNQQPHI